LHIELTITTDKLIRGKNQWQAAIAAYALQRLVLGNSMLEIVEAVDCIVPPARLLRKSFVV
jgi:hypothetical protein